MRRLLLAALLASLAAASQAQTGRPIHVLVPFAPGGASDTYARIAAQKITEQTGKAFVVENKAGAGGRICWEALAKSAPDGATVAMIDATYTMLPGLFEKLPWDVSADVVHAADAGRAEVQLAWPLAGFGDQCLQRLQLGFGARDDDERGLRDHGRRHQVGGNVPG